MVNPQEIFSAAEIDILQKTIEDAEKKSTGEICVHIDEYCSGDPVEKAKKIFKLRSLHKTKLRNAVLFYIAINDHKFAIWGDRGINEKVNAKFWDEVSQILLEKFKTNQYALGLEKAIKITGENLQKYFPVDENSSENELDNEISFGKGK